MIERRENCKNVVSGCSECICSYAAGHVSDKAFLILYKEYKLVNLRFPYLEDSFRVDDLDNSEINA